MPKLGAWQGERDRLLAENAERASRKQLTLMRAFEALRGLGYEGGYNTVRRYARGWSRSRAAAPDAAFVPLSFAPGEALDLDSMDILNFVAPLHARTGRPIPEADTPKLLTLAGLVAYFYKTELAH